MIKKIPKPVLETLTIFHQNGFEAYVVGGSLRDTILNKKDINDWDITTNAVPSEIIELFPDSFYENDFGTVGIKTEPFLSNGKKNREHDVIEATTYRIESTYSDKRRPDEIKFAKTLKEDLSRRDFTMNALALNSNNELIDEFNGQNDIKNKIIRAVGDADIRFNEDALRMMRAVRFAAQLNFKIEEKTMSALTKNADLLPHVSMERIQEEFSKIVMSSHPRHGIQLLHDSGLLKHIIPELEKGIGVAQNHHHIYDVWEHNLRALETCPSKKLSVKLAALLHDIGKPKSKRGKARDCTFYNHEYIGEHMTRKILQRMKYSKKIITHTSMLVRNHMFYYSVGDVTEAAVRRIIQKVGLDNIGDLMDVRIGDRLGSNTPKAMPYKLRHFQYMVDKVSKDPVSVKMLKLNGDIMIKDLGFKPGRKIGAILDILLSEVIEQPKLNTLDYLSKRAQELDKKDLDLIQKNAKVAIKRKRSEEDTLLKERYWVK